MYDDVCICLCCLGLWKKTYIFYTAFRIEKFDGYMKIILAFVRTKSSDVLSGITAE